MKYIIITQTDNTIFLITTMGFEETYLLHNSSIIFATICELFKTDKQFKRND